MGSSSPRTSPAVHRHRIWRSCPSPRTWSSRSCWRPGCSLPRCPSSHRPSLRPPRRRRPPYPAIPWGGAMTIEQVHTSYNVPDSDSLCFREPCRCRLQTNLVKNCLCRPLPRTGESCPLSWISTAPLCQVPDRVVHRHGPELGVPVRGPGVSIVQACVPPRRRRPPYPAIPWGGRYDQRYRFSH